ncbi:MAG: cytochrome c biogenesis protein CcsA [Actinomycetota bacterium]
MSRPASIDRNDRSLRILGGAAWGSLAIALLMMFVVAREATDAMGGDLQRIFYVHVPSAWLAYLSFAIVFIASIAYLRTDNRRWDLLAHSAAEIGVVFTSLVLITGPIWARPVWGTWWQWDARLTSTLVLWLTYVGYLLFRSLATDPARTGRLAAVIGIVGFFDVPIVHYSVNWWRTLHPLGPTIADPVNESGLGGPELATFFVSLAAFTLLFAWLLALRVGLGRLHDDVEAREFEAASSPEIPSVPQHS